MRIAVVGAGAVGGYFGGRLAAAGHQVHLLARGEHLRALAERGLRLRSPLGDLHGLNVPATDDPHGIGPVDVVLVTVKARDLAAAAETTQLLIDDHTAVIPLQNGIVAEAELSEALGAERVMGGVAQIEAVIAEPGVIEHRSQFAKLTFGELDGSRSSRALRFLRACEEAGIDASLSEEIIVDLWNKWIFICAFSGMTTLCRRPIGPILADEDLARVYRRLLEEMVDLARASGVALDGDAVEERLRFSREKLHPQMRSSLLGDLERGKPLELDALNGHAVRLGRRLGVPTPANEVVYAALKPFREGR
ncbi:MAG TPA: 2-dehydropantoate 2-reductase [Trueperaceae bacterium]